MNYEFITSLWNNNYQLENVIDLADNFIVPDRKEQIGYEKPYEKLVMEFRKDIYPSIIIGGH